MSIHGLPGKTPTKRKQRTVGGVKYSAQVAHYHGLPCGFTLRKGKDITRHHNGHGFVDPLDINEALQWAIDNL